MSLLLWDESQHVRMNRRVTRVEVTGTHTHTKLQLPCQHLKWQRGTKETSDYRTWLRCCCCDCYCCNECCCRCCYFVSIKHNVLVCNFHGSFSAQLISARLAGTSLFAFGKQTFFRISCSSSIYKHKEPSILSIGMHNAGVQHYFLSKNWQTEEGPAKEKQDDDEL